MITALSQFYGVATTEDGVLVRVNLVNNKMKSFEQLSASRMISADDGYWFIDNQALKNIDFLGNVRKVIDDENIVPKTLTTGNTRPTPMGDNRRFVG